jgi:hypothetical protein
MADLTEVSHAVTAITAGGVGTYTHSLPGQRSTQLAEIADTANSLTFMGQAKLHVSGRRLLRTPIAQWFEDRGLLSIMTLASVGIIMALSVTQPGWTTVDALKGDDRHSARRPARIPFFVIIFLVVHVWFLMAQRANRTIFFAAAQSFECFILVACCIVGQVALKYNQYMVFGGAGVFDIEWQVMEYSRDVFIVIPFNICVGTFDSFLLRRRYRVLLQCLFSLNIAIIWTRNRLDTQFWMSERVCYWLWCGRLKTIYLACLSQALIFLLKGAFAYMCGHPFAHIRADYKLWSVGSEPCAIREVRDHEQGAESGGDTCIAPLEHLQQTGEISELLLLREEVKLLRAMSGRHCDNQEDETSHPSSHLCMHTDQKVLLHL